MKIINYKKKTEEGGQSSIFKEYAVNISVFAIKIKLLELKK